MSSGHYTLLAEYHTGKTTAGRLAVVFSERKVFSLVAVDLGETSVTRHRGGPIQGPLKPCGTPQHFFIEGYKGDSEFGFHYAERLYLFKGIKLSTTPIFNFFINDLRDLKFCMRIEHGKRKLRF